MKELETSPHPFDSYLQALMLALSMRYTNLSVNRGRKTITFFYSSPEGDHQFTMDKDEVLKCYTDSEYPKEIVFLLERADKTED